MATNPSPRIISPSAVIAARAMLSCNDETAIELIEVLRPHMESVYQVRVRELSDALAAANAEIARLNEAR